MAVAVALSTPAAISAEVAAPEPSSAQIPALTVPRRASRWASTAALSGPGGTTAWKTPRR
ncbi:hypothetical protein KJK32_24440 [Streptomyces sp. JCM17656]|nr:hypothetical protein KJK32_24440 [Streptomyces sp. JCM17656]